KRALTILTVAVGERPGVTAVVGAKEPAFIGFNQRPDAVAAVGHSHANATQSSVRQSVAGEMLPRGAAIGGAIQPASPAGAIHAPGRAPRLPQRSKNNVWIVGVEREIDSAGVFVFEENLGPVLAAISGAIDAALRVRAERMAQRSHINDV